MTRRTPDRVGRPGTTPTCLARLCAALGSSVDPRTNRIVDLPPGVAIALGALDRVAIVFVHQRVDCETNHIELTSYGRSNRFNILYCDVDQISGCSCGPGAIVCVYEVTMAELFLSATWDFLKVYRLYASHGDEVVASMERYHAYLTENYEGGVDRFFSPTGALRAFQRDMELTVAEVTQHTFASSVDDAVRHLEPVVFGSEGVFDLTAEPGTGKTSVLPFKFPSKRVVVALPTPFDAWNAFNMATGSCFLDLRGLRLGSQKAKVRYTDSYTAMALLLSSPDDFDVLIVDECDSDRGVTKFLGEVKASGKVLIRMSASHGRTGSGPSKSFAITECATMPDMQTEPDAAVRFIAGKNAGRCLVLAPDAVTAKEIQAELPGSVLITPSVGLGNVARALVDKTRNITFVTDDVCARSINLDLDMLFDSQLVTEYGTTRHVTAAEAYQRRHRVGRNRSGWYFCPGLPNQRSAATSGMDLVRHNVARVYAGVRQAGDSSNMVSDDQARRLLCSPVEPYVVLQREAQLARRPAQVVELDDDDTASSGSSGSSGYVAPPRQVTVEKKPPSWLLQLSGCGKPVTSLDWRESDVATLGKENGRLVQRVRRSSGSGHSLSSLASVRMGLDAGGGRPYGASGGVSRHVRRSEVVSIPMAPPLMDLTELEYDMNWPELLRVRVEQRLALPTLVPPVGWRHASSGGMRVDWVREIRSLAAGDCQFDDEEFEVVARAWNRLVARDWVSYTPGVRGRADPADVEFCLRYFQASYVLSGAC